ncbi:MAG: Spy/CpxP family protein refolding chaperone [Pyrinomonadaceae bacterium]
MMNIKEAVSTFAILIVLLAATPVYALCSEQQQGGPVEDPVRELNLSPEQRERIRAIREQTRDERAAINQRLRATNRALEEMLDSENPIEAALEQRLREVAEAQAASMRMRVLTEFRIRRVLTPEQLNTLRTLRQNARDARRGRDWENRDVERREGIERQRGLRNQRNALRPFFPRRGDSSVKPRQ